MNCGKQGFDTVEWAVGHWKATHGSDKSVTIVEREVYIETLDPTYIILGQRRYLD